VLPGPKVHVFILPYRAQGKLTARGRELATIVQRHVLFAALKYRSIAVAELTGQAEDCEASETMERVQRRLADGQTAIFLWGRLFEQGEAIGVVGLVFSGHGLNKASAHDLGLAVFALLDGDGVGALARQAQHLAVASGRDLGQAEHTLCAVGQGELGFGIGQIERLTARAARFDRDGGEIACALDPHLERAAIGRGQRVADHLAPEAVEIFPVIPQIGPGRIDTWQPCDRAAQAVLPGGEDGISIGRFEHQFGFGLNGGGHITIELGHFAGSEVAQNGVRRGQLSMEHTLDGGIGAGDRAFEQGQARNVFWLGGEVVAAAAPARQIA